MFLIITVHMQAAAQPSHENPPLGMRLMYYPNVNPMTCLKPNFPHFELRYSTVEVSIKRFKFSCWKNEPPDSCF